MPVMSIIGERTKQKRETLGLSQPQLAEAVNAAAGKNVCSQQTIQQLEIGKTGLPRYLQHLAKALGVSDGWLRGEVEIETPSEKIILDPDEVRLLETYRRADTKQKAKILRVAKDFAE